ncbi:MAG TPA: RsmE family RNA methyltransferase [Pyrinomonadaceae bacterium]|nr:RsmE family RNA methyltransferase [Pyrinomonadaceae bacterium]
MEFEIMRRFYVSSESFFNHRIKLSLEESKHLREVLRLRAGDEVSVFDGKGKEFSCLVAEVGAKRDSSVLRILREIPPTSPESDLDLTLGVAILKGEKFDLVVQKCVELGVTKLVPISTKRADAKTIRLERWQKIAVEAAKQSGRAKLMQIAELIDFTEFIETANGAKILFSERNGENFSTIKADKKITAVIGAEGGWEDSEIESAIKNDFQIITLSGRILRAETAAIAISAILQNRFGDLC